MVIFTSDDPIDIRRFRCDCLEPAGASRLVGAHRIIPYNGYMSIIMCQFFGKFHRCDHIGIDASQPPCLPARGRDCVCGAAARQLAAHAVQGEAVQVDPSC